MKVTSTVRRTLLLLAVLATGHGLRAQTDKEQNSIWREVSLGELDYQKEKNYCLRLYGYYRYTNDGTAYAIKRKDKLYRVHEGICELDVRYDRKEDEGVEVLVGRNLVHPEKPGNAMDFYQLTPYTFLEKARRSPKHFTIEERGDTTRVYTHRGLAGTALRDTLRRELLMDYNALAPDTLKTMNLLVVNARLTNVQASAVYRTDEDHSPYVPQGNLKHITFDGDIELQIAPGVGVATDDRGPRKLVKIVYHEHSELYIDSVAYLTKAEYKADRKTPLAERRKRAGYTEADIDRLRQELGVPPLSDAIRQRIEEQYDWEDMTEHWEKTNKVVQAMEKSVGKAMEKGEQMVQQDERMKKAAEAVRKKVEHAIELQTKDKE